MSPMIEAARCPRAATAAANVVVLPSAECEANRAKTARYSSTRSKESSARPGACDQCAESRVHSANRRKQAASEQPPRCKARQGLAWTATLTTIATSTTSAAKAVVSSNMPPELNAKYTVSAPGRASSSARPIRESASLQRPDP